MREIVEDWIFFCVNDVQYPHGNFHALFTEGLTEDEIDVIYSHFPQAEKLSENMKRYKVDQSSQLSVAPKDELEELINRDYDLKGSVLEMLFPDRPKGTVVQKEAATVKTERLNDIWSQTFFDYLSDSQNLVEGVKERLFVVLYDALYMATSSFEIRLFLYSPLLKVNYDAEHLCEFIMKQGIYALTEEELRFGLKTV